MSLIFNEIIEINFWGLSENTKRKIIERAINEKILQQNNYIIDEDLNSASSGETSIELVENDAYE